MSVEISDVKKNVIKKVAEEEGFKDFTIDVKSGSLKGDGYLGIINTVRVEEKNNADKFLDLILKSASEVQKFREIAPVKKVYERELFMYQTVFPELDKLSDEKGIKHRFTEKAKCYGGSLEDYQECVLLENLREIGYKLWDRMKPMNSEHVAKVFESYAKFHASFLALKNLKKDKFDDISKNLVNVFEREDEDSDSMGEKMKAIFANGFKSVAGNEKATAALLKFTQECGTFFKVTIKEVDKFTCILHGDCWCNNMMFKYNAEGDPKNPSDMCFLDFQLSSLGSPILDLSYFFYATGSKDIFGNLRHYLEIYHQSLSKTLEEAGLDPKLIMTFEELEDLWKKYCKFGLFMTIFVMNVVVSESHEAPDLGKEAEAGKDILDSIVSANSANIAIGLERIANVITCMVDQGFL